MIKLVVFDWNGTLLADTSPVLKASNLALESVGVEKMTLKILKEKVIIPISDYYLNLGYKEELVVEATQKHLEVFHPSYEGFASKARTRAGAKMVLKYLKNKGIISIILSHHTTIGIEKQLKRLGLEGYFEAVMANEVKTKIAQNLDKRAKLQAFLKSKRIRNSEVIIVGDSPGEAIIGRELKIKSICIKDGNYSTKRLKEAQPDYLISSLKEIIMIVERINAGN